MSLIATEISQGVARGASKYDFETVSFLCRYKRFFIIIKKILQNPNFILLLIKLNEIPCIVNPMKTEYHIP